MFKEDGKFIKSTIAEGQEIDYNFIKLHQALEEKTPAEKKRERIWYKISGWNFS